MLFSSLELLVTLAGTNPGNPGRNSQDRKSDEMLSRRGLQLNCSPKMEIADWKAEMPDISHQGCMGTMGISERAGVFC